jgi:hypothetical protein
VTGDLVPAWSWTVADTVGFTILVAMHVTVLVMLASGGGC